MTETVAPHDPFQALGEAVNALATALVEAFRPIFEALIETLTKLIHALGLDTNRGRRRWRKAMAIQAHRDRVAARVPWWKRS